MRMKRVKPQILQRTEDYLVVDKPAGWLSIADRYDPEKPNMLDFFGKNEPELFPVHRLDRGTSGLMLFALNAGAHRDFNALFAERQIQKSYLAIVHGAPPDTWTNESPIAHDPQSKSKMCIHPRGKKSKTGFSVIERYKYHALVEACPHTGRTHQIRVHLQDSGHPLLVDEQYGGQEAFFLSSIMGKKYRLAKGHEERALLQRTPLHASSLSFEWRGEQQSYHSPLHKDMSACIKQMNKQG